MAAPQSSQIWGVRKIRHTYYIRVGTRFGQLSGPLPENVSNNGHIDVGWPSGGDYVLEILHSAGVLRRAPTIKA